MKNDALKRFVGKLCFALFLGAALTACSSGSGDNHSGGDDGGGNASGDLSDSQINAPGGKLSATIRTTTGGVPHITADNLESVAFGSGYVQARDNVCIIADSIIRARGERAKFYGPGPDLTPGLGVNIVSDFSYKALGLLDRANEEFEQLSQPSQAMIRGFVAGYNKYVDDTDPADLPSRCESSPWVRDISAQDLYAYYQLVALYASGDNFVEGPLFAAVPPGTNPAPMPATASAGVHGPRNKQAAGIARALRGATPQSLGLKSNYHQRGMASNGWGIGREMTENGRGALLANPHFPYTGSRRLYQSQLTVPGVYNVNGAALIGFVIPLIGFNEHVAWTHTVSTAQHFTLYDLTLKSGDPLTYIKDGEEKPITQKTLTVEIANGSPTPTTLQRSFYYSEYGPMLAANTVNEGLPTWGDEFAGRPTAFTYRDANIDTARQVVDQWLGMGRADNLEQFKKPFKACGSVLWVNTMYADDQGNAFYIDGSTVPQLSPEALSAFKERAASDPVVAALAANNLTLLDGSKSANDWGEGSCAGLTAYDGMPKLERADYVQNSNDSYWATNPNEFLTGASPLYGPTESTLTPRTRMGLRMLENPADTGFSEVAPAGSDGKFTGEEIINALYSDRAYYAETLLDELRSRCDAAGDTAIFTDTGSRSVTAGCAALAGWNGVYDLDSTGAQVFRVFIGNYDPTYPGEFSVAFDATKPETTPSTPNPAPSDPTQDPMLVALATGLNALDQAGIAYDARLGDIQRQQQSAGVPPNGTAAKSGAPIPWHGTQNFEGGFNIVSVDDQSVDDGTQYPRYAPADTIPNTGDLSTSNGEGWLVGYGTSWHFGLNFTDNGPQGYGLVSYSQSDDPSSDHFADQDQRYSGKDYRKLLYSDADIEADENLKTETITATVDDSGGDG